MCGRYVIASKIEVIEKKFNVTAKKPELFKPLYNVSHGKFAPIITSDLSKEVQLGLFGFTPSWAKKQAYIVNAKAEGDSNKANDQNYTGGKGIITKPIFRDSIRSKRCLVIADCFYEGDEQLGLEKPYCIYLRDKKRPFAFAGIWEKWIDPNTSESLITFAIITTVANELILNINQHRSPVILPESKYSRWLNPASSLSTITALLNPYPTKYMNAYPVSKMVKNSKNDSPDLVKPIGGRIYSEENYPAQKENKLDDFMNVHREEKE